MELSRPPAARNPSDSEWLQVDALKSRRVTRMKHLRISLILAVLISAASASAIRAQQSQPPSPRIVDLKASDAILLKATYFAAGKPGPASCSSIKATAHAHLGTTWPPNWRQ